MFTGDLAEGILVALNLLFLVPAFVLAAGAIVFTVARLVSLLKERSCERKYSAGFAGC